MLRYLVVGETRTQILEHLPVFVKALPNYCLMPDISFLIIVVLEAGKNLARNNLFKSSQLVMNMGAR